jgi:hypothetical protein
MVDTVADVVQFVETARNGWWSVNVSHDEAGEHQDSNTASLRP